MAEFIEHEGVVVGMGPTGVQVQIEQSSACAGCHAKSSCGASDRKDRIIDATVVSGAFMIGDRVMVYGAKRIGFLSVLLAFIVPALLILVTIIFSTIQGLGEVTGGSLGLAILIPYYLVLYFLRNRLSSEFRFYVRPL